MIHCTNCGHVNPEGATHCEACYDTLPALTSCPTCQTAVPDDAFFCPQCGASLPRGVSHQSESPGAGVDDQSLTAPPAFSDLPPTNVVAQEALGASPIPPTDVVSFPESASIPPTNEVSPDYSASDLPPTNVVNVPPSVSDLPPTNVVNTPPPPSDLPPTNVVNTPPPPSDLPPTNVVNTPPPPSDLPPTNVVNPDNLEELPPTNVVEASPSPYLADTLPPRPAPISPPEPEPVDDIESVPTMVVSPGSNRDVIESPPIQKSPPTPVNQPEIPATMPPQAPPVYQSPPPIEPPPPVESPAPVELPPPLLETPPPVEIPSVSTPPTSPESATPSFEGTSATTMQPFSFESPTVGDTLIQLPSAQLIHERTDTPVTLPRQELILIGKITDTVSPDVDVASFVDSDVVSRRHAAIFMEDNSYFIEDLGSSNGTYVNDILCEQGERVQIQPGDRICLGRENKVGFIFKIG